MKLNRTTTAILFIGVLGASASAQSLSGNLLLRQVNSTAGNFVNQTFSDFPATSAGMGSLVTVGGLGWNIANIQLSMTGQPGNTVPTGVTTAILTVSQQVSGLPSNSIDPNAINSGSGVVFSGNVGVTFDTVATSNASFRMIANTSSVSALQGLAAGNYVFSLVMNGNFGASGQAFTNFTTPANGSGYVRNTGGGFGFGTDWIRLDQYNGDPIPANSDWAIGINGTTVVPEPASMAALGLGALALIRKRRSKRA